MVKIPTNDVKLLELTRNLNLGKFIEPSAKMSSPVMHTKDNIHKKKERANPPEKISDNFSDGSLSKDETKTFKNEVHRLIDELEKKAKKQEIQN